MIQIKLGLRKKITILCIIMAVAICSGACMSGYHIFKKSAFQIFNESAYNIAYNAASYVNADKITSYLETKQIDEEYEEMADHLYRLHEYNHLVSIYICIPNEEDLTITNIYDTRVDDPEKDPARYALGVVDPIGLKDRYAAVRIYKTGKREDDYFIRKTSFGYLTSAIIPLFNSEGSSVAILTVDMQMPVIISRLNQYLLITIAITTILVSVMMVAYLIYLRKHIINPIRQLTLNAAGFAANHNTFSDSVRKLKTGDEIETLAGALVKMENDITKYIDNLAKVTAERERIAAELDVATTIQTDMLPSIFPPYPDCNEFDIYATMDPAKEVGGDFYDFFLIDDNHLGLVMADVSGKGIPAALFMVISKTLIKNAARPGISPKDVLEAVNCQLCENNDASMFVTVWFGIMEISTGKITAVNAGHEKPLIMRKDGDFEYLRDKHGIMLASFSTAKYKEYELQINPGDRLFLYTDGLLEATNGENELYGEERALVSLNKHKSESLSQMLESIHKDVDVFVGDALQFDDLTMMVLEYYG